MSSPFAQPPLALLFTMYLSLYWLYLYVLYCLSILSRVFCPVFCPAYSVPDLSPYSSTRADGAC